jgi:glycosyltransferase involved in cell wall biosynthesis
VTRVLHVSSGNLYGGVEVLLSTLARTAALAPALEQHFALAFAGRIERELRELGAPVHLVPEARASRPLGVLATRRALRRVLERVQPDAVICHATWAHAMYAAAVRGARVPLVHFMHGPSAGRHWLDRWAARTPPDLALANSKFTGTTLANIFPGVPVEVFYCPVPEPPLSSAASRARTRAAVGAQGGRVVIVQVSRMEPIKGHGVHLDALARLDRSLDWECWMVGGAQREDEQRYIGGLREQAERLGVAGRVRFLGQRSDVRELLAAADIFCQPNVGPEGFGLVFVEALWAGLPVVTSELGGAPEVVDASCGVLLPAGEAGRYAEALDRLVRHPEERRRLGAAGPARAAALCEPRQQLNRLDALLGGAVGARRGRDG